MSRKEIGRADIIGRADHMGLLNSGNRRRGTAAKFSSKDKRLLSIDAANHRQQLHREEVRLMDLEQKVLSGESRSSTTGPGSGSGDRHSSGLRGSWSRHSASNSISLVSSLSTDGVGFTDADDSKSTRFLKEKAAIVLAVKDRLRKMVSGQKTNSHSLGLGTDSWISRGASSRRIMFGGWSTFATCRSRISRCHGFSYYPDSKISRLAQGEEHPERSVICYVCQGSIDSTSYQLVPLEQGTCLHAKCLEQLLQH